MFQISRVQFFFFFKQFFYIYYSCRAPFLQHCHFRNFNSITYVFSYASPKAGNPVFRVREINFYCCLYSCFLYLVRIMTKISIDYKFPLVFYVKGIYVQQSIRRRIMNRSEGNKWSSRGTLVQINGRREIYNNLTDHVKPAKKINSIRSFDINSVK